MWIKTTTRHSSAVIRPGRYIYLALTMLGLVISCGARFGLLEPVSKGNIFANCFRVFAAVLICLGVWRTSPEGVELLA
jgi:hypothetical protein